MSQSFDKRIPYYTERVEDRLDKVLPPADRSPRRLHDAMRYAVFNGGKRVRPLLVYATGECLRIPEHALDVPAVAIELIHSFSLVHDDLPSMDDDDLRRGKPTVHRKFDEATAILSADALQPLAFGVLCAADDIAATTRSKLVQLLASAAGSLGMTGGQALDLAATGRSLTAEDIETMYSLKTGALIHAAVAAAALLCEDLANGRAAAIDAFGRTIGIAFQIKDDILDVEGDTEVIGKRSGADQRLCKATYPGLVGISAARARCDQLLRSALEQLDDFGADAEPLRWLARYIVERAH